MLIQNEGALALIIRKPRTPKATNMKIHVSKVGLTPQICFYKWAITSNKCKNALLGHTCGNVMLQEGVWASRGHVSSSQCVSMEKGASPRLWSCHIINGTPSGHQAPSSSNPRRWHHHQMKANVTGVMHCVQGGEGCISSLQGIQLSTGAMSSIQWVISPRVHCPTCGLSTHLCAIMTKSVRTKPIYPLSKVLKMWEPMFEGAKLVDDSLPCITHDKILQ